MAFINPKLWGPAFWATMHWTAAGYSPEPSEEDKQYYKLFYENLIHTLPCTECREHYAALLQQMPIEPFLGSGRQLRQWVTALHNAVNSNTGSVQHWTVEQVEIRFPPAPLEMEEPQVLPPPHIKTLVVPLRRAPLPMPSGWKQLRNQQQILHNNARSLGRVQKPPPTVIRRVVRSAAVNLNVPTVPPRKKKGCGCNKRTK